MTLYPPPQPGPRGAAFTRALGSSLGLLALLSSIACTSGGGNSPAAAASGAGSPAFTNLNVEANGGVETNATPQNTSGLVNRSIIGQDTGLKTSTSSNGSLKNQSGFPVPPPGGPSF